MFLPKLNPIEPPWYGPVCPVVWEGWHREVSPYPDLRRNLAIGVDVDEGPQSIRKLPYPEIKQTVWKPVTHGLPRHSSA
jgi:hypothetical protein